MSESDRSKTCTKCGATKTLENFHKRSISGDGRASKCKECACAERREYTANNPEKLAAARKQYDAKNRPAKLVRIRKWQAANVEHRRIYSREYDQLNSERTAKAKRAWYEANREEVLRRKRENVEASRASGRKYREAHRDERTEAQRRRRVDKLGLKVEDVDVKALWTGECALCCEPLDSALLWPDPRSKSIDHILPLSRGGTHEAKNLQWTHLVCNVSKGARLPDELLNAKGGELPSLPDESV